MLNMASDFPGGWRPPVVKVENVFEPEVFRRGVGELCDKVREHYRHLIDTDLIGNRLRRKALLELNESLTASILEPILRELVEEGEMAKMADTVLKKESDPYTLAEQVASRYLKRCFRNEEPAS
jgi:LAO/AO transport system kinase